MKTKLKERVFTPFEMLINRDMLFNGFNPLCPVDIKKYWEARL